MKWLKQKYLQAQLNKLLVRKRVVNTKVNLDLKKKNQNLTEDKVVNCKNKAKNVNIYIKKHYEKNYQLDFRVI